MRTIAIRRPAGAFAGAKFVFTGFLDGELQRLDIGLLVRAVAKGLILGKPAGTPPVIARFQFDGAGEFLRYYGFCHNGLSC